MKIHKTLRWFSLINIVSCITFFYVLYRNLPYANDRGVNVALGWIGWLAMLTFIVPACFSDETKTAWFSKGFAVGTILLLLLNVIAVIGGDYFAYTLVK
jgi:hypothetical protein